MFLICYLESMYKVYKVLHELKALEVNKALKALHLIRNSCKVCVEVYKFKNYHTYNISLYT